MATYGSEAPTKEIKNPNPPSGTSVASGLIARSATSARAPRSPRTTTIKNAVPVRRAPTHRVPTTKTPKSTVKFGLNLSDKTPYNPLGSPYKTVGQFNKGVLKMAEGEYKPQLQNVESEVEGEKQATKERQADLGNIYNQYNQQAQQAFADAKTALAEIASRQNASSTTAQQALQAALMGGGQQNSLGSFETAGTDFGGIQSSGLAGIQSAQVGEAANMENVPAVARTEAMNTELARDRTAMEDLAAEKQKVVGSIPNAIEKARQALIANEENRQGLAFQQKLAGQQFQLTKQGQQAEIGLKNRAQGFDERKTTAELGMNQQKLDREFSLQERNMAETAGINLVKLGLEKEKIQNERGKAAGTRAKNAISIMANYLNPSKNEYLPGSTTHEPNQVPYTRNPNALYKMLQIQGGLNYHEAVQLMAASGHPEIEKWAKEFQEQERQRQAAKHAKFNKPIKLPKL